MSSLYPQVYTAKLMIPQDKYPDHNFIGLIIGPRGNTQKRMEKESRARIVIRGKGSTKRREGPSTQEDEADLHVHISADNQEAVDKAMALVTPLLEPEGEHVQVHKAQQLEELAVINNTARRDSNNGISSDIPHELRCGTCSNIAVNQCIDCPGWRMCVECSINHLKPPVSRHHMITSFAPYNNQGSRRHKGIPDSSQYHSRSRQLAEPEFSNLEALACPIHPDQSLTHFGCNLDEEELQEKKGVVNDAVERQLYGVQQNIGRLEQAVRNLQRDDIYNGIQLQFKALKDAIARREQELLKQLALKTRSAKYNLELQIKELQSAEALTVDAQELLMAATASEGIDEAWNLSASANIVEPDISSLKFSVMTSSLLNQIDDLGELIVPGGGGGGGGGGGSPRGGSSHPMPIDSRSFGHARKLSQRKVSPNAGMDNQPQWKNQYRQEFRQPYRQPSRGFRQKPQQSLTPYSYLRTLARNSSYEESQLNAAFAFTEADGSGRPPHHSFGYGGSIGLPDDFKLSQLSNSPRHHPRD